MPPFHSPRLFVSLVFVALVAVGCQPLRSAKRADDPDAPRLYHKMKGKTANEPAVTVRVGTQAPQAYPLPPGGATVGSLLFSAGVFGYDDTGAVTVQLPAVLTARPTDIDEETTRLVVHPTEVPRAVVRLTAGREGQVIRLTFPLAVAVNTTLSRLELRDGDDLSVVDVADTAFAPDSALAGQSQVGVFAVAAGGRPAFEFPLTADQPMTVSRFVSEERFKPFLPDVAASSDTIIGVRRGGAGRQTELCLFPLNQLYLQARTTLAHDSLAELYRTGVFYRRLILPGDEIEVGVVEEVPEVLALLITPLADRLNALRRRPPPRVNGPVTAVLSRLGVDPREGQVE